MIRKSLAMSAFRAPSGRVSPATSPRWIALLVIWLLALIATPIAVWTGGENTFPAMAVLGVIAQACVVLAALARAWPWSRIARATGFVVAGAWAAEALGTATGFPFGHYAYTDRLWPQVADVPLLIPLAWLMMLPPAWAVTAAILRQSERAPRGRAALSFAVVSGLAFTAWDLYLDPQMVDRGLWTWDSPGGYFGIPWVNFLGWWAVATLITWLVRPADLPRRPLLIVYTLVWLFQAVGLGVFWGQPGPAAVGFVAMGAFAVAAWRQERRP